MWYREGRSKRYLKWFGYGIAGAGALITLFFLLVSWWIGSAVRSSCSLAMREHDGDQVIALMRYADSSSHSLRDRNRAVWALGNLGDARALPLLEKYYTGSPCDHDRMLCQNQLKTAIELCRGGLNLPALVWRRPTTSNR